MQIERRHLTAMLAALTFSGAPDWAESENDSRKKLEQKLDACLRDAADESAKGWTVDEVVSLLPHLAFAWAACSEVVDTQGGSTDMRDLHHEALLIATEALVAMLRTGPRVPVLYVDELGALIERPRDDASRTDEEIAAFTQRHVTLTLTGLELAQLVRSLRIGFELAERRLDPDTVVEFATNLRNAGCGELREKLVAVGLVALS